MPARLLLKLLGQSWVQSLMDRLRGSPLGYRLARGFAWSTLGAVVARGMALLAAVLVARILGRENYGRLGVVQSTIGMFSIFAGFGLGITATKYVAEFRTKDPERARRLIAMSGFVAAIAGSLMSVVLIVLAPWLATRTLAAPELSRLLTIAAPMLFLGAVNGAQTGALSGLEAFRAIARVNTWSGLAGFALMVGGAYLSGLEGAVLGLVAVLAVNWALNRRALSSEADAARIPLGVEGAWRESAVLWRFSVPAALSAIMVGPAYWVCSAIVVNRPRGYEEMGLFNAANQWFGALLFLPGILGQVVLPVLSERLATADHDQPVRVLTASIVGNGLTVVPLAVIISVASPLIMLFYGPDFRSGWPTLVVVAITGALLAVQLPAGQAIAAKGQMWLGFWMNTGWALAFVGLTLVLADRGAFGLALARLAAYGVHTTWTLGWVYAVFRHRERSAGGNYGNRDAV